MHKKLDDAENTNLDPFLRILDLIQKYYVNCTNNLERLKATILIIKEAGP